MACNTFVCAILGTINSVAVNVPCKEWAVPLSPRHEIIDGVAILGKLKAKCVTPMELPSGTMKSITVAFPPPRTFADAENTPATLADISHFEVEFDGDNCIYVVSITDEGERTESECSVLREDE